MKRIIISVLLIGLFSLLGAEVCSLAMADVVYLKNGNELEGRITEETNEFVELKMSIGVVKLKREQIGRIEKKHISDEQVLTSKELYEKKIIEIDETDIVGRLELVNECLEKGLRNEALAELEKISRLKPSIKMVLKLCVAQIRAPKTKKELKTSVKKEQAKKTLSPKETSKQLKLYRTINMRTKKVKRINGSKLRGLRNYGHQSYRQAINYWIEAAKFDDELVKLMKKKARIKKKKASSLERGSDMKYINRDIEKCETKREKYIQKAKQKEQEADLQSLLKVEERN